MNALLLCGGEQHRLIELPYPKQLIAVAGEPILYRTVRLLRELSHDCRIFVVARAGILTAACAELGVTECVVDAAPMFSNIQSVMRTHQLESAMTLLGDVCWSRALLYHWLCECENRPTLWCGRIGPSAITSKPYSEHFAVYCTLDDLRRLDARRFYRLEDAARTTVFGEERHVAPPILDFTEDFDTLDDVSRLVPLLTERVLQEAA